MKKWLMLFLAVCLALTSIGMFSAFAAGAPLCVPVADKPQAAIIASNNVVSCSRSTLPISSAAAHYKQFIRAMRVDKPSAARAIAASAGRICHAGQSP